VQRAYACSLPAGLPWKDGRYLKRRPEWITNMTLTDLGYNAEIENYIQDNNLVNFTIGRVTQEHRERYIVSTGENEFETEITGNLRFSANSREDFPAVGDWVTMSVYDSNMAIIHKVLPRKSILERQAIGKFGEKQIISANIDVALIVQSIDNNFSINRLERYLTICHSAKIEPVLVISKIDLSSEEKIKMVCSARECNRINYCWRHKRKDCERWN